MLDPLSAKLDHYMTLLSTRQRIVASNLANTDTPDYKTKDIDFEAEFRRVSATPGATAIVNEVPGLRVKNDGNNVDIDREARMLSENTMRFNVASNLLRGQLKSIRLAISGGSGQ